MEDIKLIHGDFEQVFKDLPDASAKLIYTDPPYEMDYLSNIPGSKEWNKSGISDSKFEERLRGDSEQKQDSVNWEAFFEQAFRVLKDDSFLIFHANIPFLMRYGNIPLKFGFKYKGTIAWNKKFAIGGDLKAAMKRDWEPIVYYAKGKPTINPVEVLRKGNLETRKRISEISDWEFVLPKLEKIGHPTQKPIELGKQIISLMSNPDDLVIDPFAGAGTCAFICRDLGRKNISIEIDKKYFDIMEKRIYNNNTN